MLDLLADPLSEIINCSLRNGTVPLDIKLAKVLPIYKQGPKSSISNYRPISILTYFSKLFEKVMYDRLLSYVKHKNILHPYQHGFQPGHSTSMSPIDVQDKISQAMDNNEYSIGIFLDLAKAFDTVNHTILLSKLEHYGIRDNALLWFKSYLSNRSQQVLCNGKLSKFLRIDSGVPQGSILGPLLFLIFINDLPNSSSVFIENLLVKESL
jgi:retron-type reverse transcriptase